MIKNIRDYHHFRQELLNSDDRVAKIERRVIDILINSSLNDVDRESSIAFELKHSSSTTQFARVLARKRGLNVELCAIGAVLHDIYVIIEGKYKDHATFGGELAIDIMKDTADFTDAEYEIVKSIIVNHSDKHIWTNDSYVEFGKDVDVLDCFLYPNAIEYYLKNKSLSIMREYLARAKMVWRDLGIPVDNSLRVLDNYNENWLDKSFLTDKERIYNILYFIERESGFEAPVFLIRDFDSEVRVNINSVEYANFIDGSKGSSRVRMAFKCLANDSAEMLNQSSGHIVINKRNFVVWPSLKMIQPLSDVDLKNKEKEFL